MHVGFRGYRVPERTGGAGHDGIEPDRRTLHPVLNPNGAIEIPLRIVGIQGNLTFDFILQLEMNRLAFFESAQEGSPFQKMLRGMNQAFHKRGREERHRDAGRMSVHFTGERHGDLFTALSPSREFHGGLKHAMKAG